MSVAEIVQELPKLTLSERRLLVEKIQELEPERESAELCNSLADETMQVLDQMEEEDARRKKG